MRLLDENTILPEITIDQDGNDEVDSILLPDNTNLQLKTLIAILREKIEQVETTDDIRQALVNHVNLLESATEKQEHQFLNQIDNFKKFVDQQKKAQNLQIIDAQYLLDLLDLVKDGV